ncbi:hypothetical protein BRADI_1g67883v3 [Brachypodium distachyon]|uniref:Uncharacterized protein n=1 Tax=Brachypodium distachyon TaxID=15368 RepID=A0A2K2DTW1_BRADI|nr:hypothetical protein BRADI_1g67883v3 [Brachypodium distachyon]
MSRKGWMRWKLKIYDMEVHSDRSIQVVESSVSPTMPAAEDHNGLKCISETCIRVLAPGNSFSDDRSALRFY